MFEFYFSILKKIALCSHILITFSSKCDIMELEPNEFIMGIQQNERLIEMDSDSFEQLNQISFVLTQQAFNISYLESQQRISSIIVDYIFYHSIQYQWICQLIRHQSYNILCNNYINLSPTNNDKINMEIQFKVDISIEQAYYNCDEFFQWQNSNFLLFCSSQNMIKIYSVNMSNTTLLITEKEIDQYQFEQCIREYIKLSNEQFFIILYGCFQWAIFEFSGSSLNLLMDQNIILNKTNQSIPYVQRIQICKYQNKQFSEQYLITNNGYYQFIMNNNTKQLSWVSFQKFQNIKQLIFTNWCQVNYQIIYQNQITIIMLNKINKELNIPSNVIQVYESSNLLFVLTNKGLDVILNEKIKQHIQIQTNRLFFVDNYKYFYYLDENNSQIAFYNYNDLNSYLIPAQTYVFKIWLKDYFEIILVNCYKIEIKNNIDQSIVINDFYFLNSCQEYDIIFFDKQNIVLPQQYDFQVSQEQIATILNITEIVDFQYYCDVRFISKDSILIYWENNYTVFKNNHYFQVKQCINNINFKIPIQQNQSVYHNDLAFLVIKKGDKQIKRIQQSLSYQIPVENEIESFSTFENYVLIITVMGQNIMIININSSVWEELSKKLISTLFQIYNREKPNNHTIFYYSKLQNYYFIQFLNNFIIYDQNKDYINIQPLKNIQIISVNYMISNQYQIIAVHQIEDVIFQYIFINQQHFQQMTLQHIYPFRNAKIQRPLKFQVINHQPRLLLILIDNDIELQLQIIQVSKTRPLKLIRIINVSIPEFFVVNWILHYYDNNFKIKAIDIFQFHIKFNNLVINQGDVFQNNNLTFNIVQKNTTENVIKCIFRLQQFNLCHKIFKIHNSIEIVLNNKLKQEISISDFIVGPIDNLYITNNSMIKLNGFYLQQIPIMYCSQSNENNCIFIIKLSNKLLPDFNQNQIAHIFKQNEQNILLSLKDQFQQFNKPKSKLLDIFLINEWQLVMLTSSKNQMSITIQDIDKNTFQISNEQQFQLQTNFHHQSYKIHQTGNIIQVKQIQEEILIFTNSFQIKYLDEIQNFKECLLFVEDSNQLYVELQSKNQNLIINILKFDNDNITFELIHFVELNHTIINNHLHNHFNQDFNRFQQLISNHLLKSIQKRNQINLILLSEYQIYSLILNISLQLNNTYVQFEIQKVIRNPKTLNSLKSIFYQYNVLILTSNTKQRYLYDLNQKKQFYDYYYIENSTSKLISSINSTHFLFSNSNENYSFGQLNYQIELLEGHQNQETCTLVAENSISKTDIKLIITTQSEGQIWIIVLLIISNILILLFIIGKSLIKIIHQKQIAHQTQIELQNSNVSNFNQ